MNVVKDVTEFEEIVTNYCCLSKMIQRFSSVLFKLLKKSGLESGHLPKLIGKVLNTAVA
jgi:hypothetical protein